MKHEEDMALKRNILIITLVGVLSSASTYYITSLFSNNKIAKPSKPILNSSSNKDNDDEINHLRSENAELNRKIVQLLSLQKSTAPTPQKAIDENTPLNCESAIKDALSVYIGKDKLLADLSNMTSSKNYDEKLQEEFNSEEKNDNWSQLTEKKILDAIAHNASSQAISISYVSCKSKTCQMKIPVSNIDTKNHVAQTLSDPNLTKAMGFNTSIVKTSMGISGGEMIMYISNPL